MARARLDWRDAVVVVTGATRGIGRSVTEAVASRGARVGVLARTAHDVDALVASLPPGRAAGVAADAGDRESVRAALARLADELGPATVLVNNAGVGLYGPVASLDPADAERLVRSNYLSVVYATCAVLPAMLRRGRGSIVTVGSIAGLVASPYEAAYAASKFAVTGFCEAMAVELSPRGIEVTMVHPGPVATTFFERRGHPYTRSRPAPLDPARVCAAVVRAVEHGTRQQVLPRWLGSAPVTRAVLPGLYRRGVAASFRRETDT